MWMKSPNYRNAFREFPTNDTFCSFCIGCSQVLKLNRKIKNEHTFKRSAFEALPKI